MQFQPTVFIVDDDKPSRDSAAAVVDTLGFPAESYESAESMLAAWKPDRAGCALIGLSLPGMSGLELMQHLLARQAPLGMVMISARGEVRAAVRAIKQGAVDVLQKPYAMEELRVSLLRAVDEGKSRCSSNDMPARLAALGTLSESERQVLELTVRGLANKNIASRLGMSLRTVHIRRAALMRKLDVKNRSELIRLVVQFDLQKSAELPVTLAFGVDHGPMEQPQRALRDGAPGA